MNFLREKGLKNYSLLITIIDQNEVQNKENQILPNCFDSVDFKSKYCLAIIDILYRLPLIRKIFNKIGSWFGYEGHGGFFDHFNPNRYSVGFGYRVRYLVLRGESVGLDDNYDPLNPKNPKKEKI